jgi:hypothetical protein
VRTVEKIRALLAHAESAEALGNEAEGESYRAKATSLMEAYAIDAALLAAEPDRPAASVGTVELVPQAPYQTDRADGIARLAHEMGGFGWWRHPKGSTKVVSMRVAVAAPEEFKSLAEAMDRMCSAGLSAVAGGRLARASWVRGYWSGVRAAARKERLRREAEDTRVGNALELAANRAEEAAKAGYDGPLAARQTPGSTADHWADGAREGARDYLARGRQLKTT